MNPETSPQDRYVEELMARLNSPESPLCCPRCGRENIACSLEELQTRKIVEDLSPKKITVPCPHCDQSTECDIQRKRKLLTFEHEGCGDEGKMTCEISFTEDGQLLISRPEPSTTAKKYAREGKADHECGGQIFLQERTGFVFAKKSPFLEGEEGQKGEEREFECEKCDKKVVLTLASFFTEDEQREGVNCSVVHVNCGSVFWLRIATPSPRRQTERLAPLIGPTATSTRGSTLRPGYPQPADSATVSGVLSSSHREPDADPTVVTNLEPQILPYVEKPTAAAATSRATRPLTGTGPRSTQSMRPRSLQYPSPPSETETRVTPSRVKLFIAAAVFTVLAGVGWTAYWHFLKKPSSSDEKAEKVPASPPALRQVSPPPITHLPPPPPEPAQTKEEDVSVPVEIAEEAPREKSRKKRSEKTPVGFTHKQ